MKIDLYEEYIYYIEYFCTRYSEIASKETSHIEYKDLMILNQGLNVIEYLIGFFKEINLFDFRRFQNNLTIQSHLSLTFHQTEKGIHVIEFPLSSIDIHKFNHLLECKQKQLSSLANFSCLSIDISSISPALHHIIGFIYQASDTSLQFHFCSIEVDSLIAKEKWKKFNRIPKSHLKTIYKKSNHQLSDEVLNQYQYSNYEVQNAFKFYFNCTYSQYVLKMRMLKALAEILFTNLTFKQIAHNNNFNSYTNMHKVFGSSNILLNNIPRILN